MTRRGADDDAKRLTPSPSLSRRDLFEFAGLAIAAAALPTQMPAAHRRVTPTRNKTLARSWRDLAST